MPASAVITRRGIAAVLAGGALAAAALTGCSDDPDAVPVSDTTPTASLPTTPTGPTTPTTPTTPSAPVTQTIADPPTSTPRPDDPSSTPAPASTGPVLGPEGFGRLRLGMGAKAANASGVLESSAMGPEECSGFRLARFPDEEDPSVYISKSRGVQAIYALGDMRTPQGIRIGTKLSVVRKAYPALKEVEQGTYEVAAPGNAEAAYTFLVGNELGVYELGLVAKGNACD